MDEKNGVIGNVLGTFLVKDRNALAYYQEQLIFRQWLCNQGLFVCYVLLCLIFHMAFAHFSYIWLLEYIKVIYRIVL